MSFGEKLKEARAALDLSQEELGEAAGLSARSIYTYEQLGIMPRKSNIRKLANALQVSVTYLTSDEETDPKTSLEEELFLETARKQCGYRGAKEAREIIGRTKTLFAGGDLDEDAQDEFFRSLVDVYLTAKADAREKFTPKKYREQASGDSG